LKQLNLDLEEVRALASAIEEEDGESLADLFMHLLELESAARHSKRPRLVKKYNEAIDGSDGGA